MSWGLPDRRGEWRPTTPIQSTVLLAFTVGLGLVVGVVVIQFVGGTGPTTTVSGGDAQCSYSQTFDPRDVAGFAADRAANERYTDGTVPCVLWLDAGASPGFDPGTPVGEWRDQSSNGFRATPTAAGPEWAVVDGVEAVRFDGSRGWLRLDAPPSALSVTNDTGLTVTMLVYVVDSDRRGGGPYAIDAADGNGSAVELSQSDRPPASPEADEWWSTPGPAAEITTDGEWAIVTHTTDGETGTLFVDGDSQGTAGDGVAALGTSVRIGGDGSGRAFEAYVAEYFVSNEQLSPGARNVVQCAMNAKHDDIVDLDVC
ncbi:LamG-like jellyroll fold domain-containing protein [Halohasta salina]|uniref:LamG-like jellyroll fold domain-containing protein n=1 Tax=Halohasta salina TaxID=2961621 RepID=UPI0020A3FBA4|nr:LamG-like jellyroll fold domain-containing protein [Halohasta salina]